MTYNVCYVYTTTHVIYVLQFFPSNTSIYLAFYNRTILLFHALFKMYFCRYVLEDPSLLRSQPYCSRSKINSSPFT